MFSIVCSVALSLFQCVRLWMTIYAYLSFVCVCVCVCV